MLETNMRVVHGLQDRISVFIPRETDMENRIDRIMEYFDSGSRMLAWVAVILTFFFILAPVWIKILWP